MKELIDISLPIDKALPRWPGNGHCRVSSSRNEDGIMDSVLTCSVHTGTHIDAPAHGLADGATVDNIPLESLMGDVQVIEVFNQKELDSKTFEAAGIENNCKRLLIKTGNSDLLENRISDFDQNFTALTPDGARWIVRHKIELIGIDYLSIQRFNESGFETHNVLLQAGTVILEGINLAHVKAGNYELICLPVYLTNVEGAPARAILRPL